MIKLKTILLSLFLIAILIILLLFSSAAMDGVLNGMQICYERIIPSLFPFTVVSLFLYNSGVLQRLISKRLGGAKTVIFIMSLIGGYPLGASLISEAHKNRDIDDITAKNMLMYCVNAGPSFTIVVIGLTLFNSRSIGNILFVSTVLSALFLMLIFYKKQNTIILKTAILPISDNFVLSVSGACGAMLTVCGFVIIFSAVISIINASVGCGILRSALILPLEVTAAAIKFKNIYVISFLVGFSGLSIILQVMAISKEIRPSFISVFFSRLIGGILTLIFTYILIFILKPKLPTISNITNIPNISSNSIAFLILFCIATAVMFYSVNSKKYCGRLGRDIF